MQKFSEFVEDYKKFRESKGLTSEMSLDDVKKIRELYESLNSKKNKVQESSEEDTEFNKLLESYRSYKFKTQGTRAVSMKEKELIKEKMENSKKSLKESTEEKKEEKTVETEKEPDKKCCGGENCDGKGCEKEKDMEDKENFDEAIEGFKKVVAQYREWKNAKYKTSKLTEEEKDSLKKKFIERMEKLEEEKKSSEDNKLEENKTEEHKADENKLEEKKDNSPLEDALKQYKEWKLANHGTDKLTAFEENRISNEVIVDKINAKLEEAKKFVESGKKHLTEGDVMDASADAQAAAGAVNDAANMGADPAMAADPNAGAGVALPQNIVDEISNIKTSIDALATECGIESPVDLGADAGAGVPAVTGAADPNVDATAADPNAAPDAQAAPLPESIKSVKARIAKRNAELKETIKFSNTKMADNKDTVKIPTEAELVNGTKSISANVKKATWPIEKADIRDATKIKNLEECTQEDLAKMTLSEDGEFSWSLYTKMLKSM